MINILIIIYRDCYFTTNSVHKKSDFIDQLNKSGGGGLTLSLRDSELTDFYHYLCKSFDFDDESNRKVGASFIGLQQDNSWILSPSMQIDADGNLIHNSYESKYVWLPHMALQNVGGSDVSFGSLSPDLHLPLSTAPLKPMLECMQLCFKHNFISSLSACSSILMILHYEKIRVNYEGCPIPFLYGESQTGKTGTAKLASSIVGMHKSTRKTPARNGSRIVAACHPCRSLLTTQGKEIEMVNDCVIGFNGLCQ